MKWHFVLFPLQTEEARAATETSLRETTLLNVTLTSEMQRSEVEMQAVQTRLLSALNELDAVKEKQSLEHEKAIKIEER